MLLHSYDIVFQEVPGETSLALNISQCPHRCHGCHSPHLWGNEGKPLTTALLDDLIQRYHGEITCVCFMGGDADKQQLRALALHVKDSHGLRTAWYSGFDSHPFQMPHTCSAFDYVKFGPYRPRYGGLSSWNTNQRMYRRAADNWLDITHKFQRSVTSDSAVGQNKF